MTENSNQNPEQKARDKIDQLLTDVGWVIQSKSKINLAAGKRIDIRTTYCDALEQWALKGVFEGERVDVH